MSANPENDCRCVDCGGDQPNHDPSCKYMADLHGVHSPYVSRQVLYNLVAAMAHGSADTIRECYNDARKELGCEPRP